MKYIHLNGSFCRWQMSFKEYFKLFSLVAFSLVSLVLNNAQAKSFVDKEFNWKIKFFTGNKIWSGTDSMINAQIYGTTGKSEIFQITPHRLQMEGRSIDAFSLGALNSKEIGLIKSITISKQHSYAFFNDWELIKVDLIDPSGKFYTFKCHCWLTTLKYKRNIELFSVNGVEIDQDDDDSIQLKRRHFKVFPITVSLLFLLLMLIIFTYFGNLIFKKWRENSHYFSQNLSRRHSRSRTHRSGRGGMNRSNLLNENNHVNANNQSDLYKTDDDEDENSGNPNSRGGRVYNFTNDLTNLNTNNNLDRSPASTTYNNQSLIIIKPILTNEDKPPEYKELFPLQPLPTSTNSNASENTQASSNLTSV